jgi:hypothetical protein
VLCLVPTAPLYHSRTVPQTSSTTGSARTTSGFVPAAPNTQTAGKLTLSTTLSRLVLTGIHPLWAVPCSASTTPLSHSRLVPQTSATTSPTRTVPASAPPAPSNTQTFSTTTPTRTTPGSALQAHSNMQSSGRLTLSAIPKLQVLTAGVKFQEELLGTPLISRYSPFLSYVPTIPTNHLQYPKQSRAHHSHPKISRQAILRTPLIRIPQSELCHSRRW